MEDDLTTLVNKRNNHTAIAETYLKNSGSRNAHHDYKMWMTSASTAHSTLAIFYQGEIRNLGSHV